MGQIKIKCLKCGDIIESMHRHDFKWCSCKSVFIDGGDDYTRCGGDPKDYVFITKDVDDDQKTQ